MVSRKKMSLVLGAALVAVAPQLAKAQDVYSECTCRTAEGPYSQGVGNVIFTSGGVIADNASASPGGALQVGSSIEVSSGSADIVVGTSCANTIPANNKVIISRPGGPGSDLCVKISTTEEVAISTNEGFTQPSFDPSGAIFFVTAGTMAAIQYFLPRDGDGGKKKRKKASP